MGEGEWRVGETTTNPTVEGIGGVNGGSARGVDVWRGCGMYVWYGVHVWCARVVCTCGVHVWHGWDGQVAHGVYDGKRVWVPSPSRRARG